MEELAHDVGGGGDAEDDGAEDLLPPGQQQHGVLPPATLRPRPALLYQADGAVAFLPVQLAVGEEVAVVYGEEKDPSVGRRSFFASVSDNSLCESDLTVVFYVPVSRVRTSPYGYWRMDRAPLLYSSWENLSLFRHLSNSSEPTRAGVRDGESVSGTRGKSVRTTIARSNHTIMGMKTKI